MAKNIIITIIIIMKSFAPPPLYRLWTLMAGGDKAEYSMVQLRPLLSVSWLTPLPFVSFKCSKITLVTVYHLGMVFGRVLSYPYWGVSVISQMLSLSFAARCWCFIIETLHIIIKYYIIYILHLIYFGLKPSLCRWAF